MSIVKTKYLKKGIYLQKKDKKLLMNWDQNNIKKSQEFQKIHNMLIASAKIPEREGSISLSRFYG